MNKIAVFDLDGTLLDTIEDLANCVNEALVHYDLLSLPIDDFKKIVGNGALNLCDVSLKKSISQNRNRTNTGHENYPDAAKLLDLFKNIYKNNISTNTKPYDGIIEALMELEKNGVKLAIISNKPDLYTKELVSIHFPKIKFQYIIGESDSFPRKPDPKSLLFIIKNLHALSEDTYYFGDSGSDMVTALNANAIPVGVLWGFRDEEELINNGAKIILEKPSDITSVFGYK